MMKREYKAGGNNRDGEIVNNRHLYRENLTWSLKETLTEKKKKSKPGQSCESVCVCVCVCVCTYISVWDLHQWWFPAGREVKANEQC